MKKFLLLIVAVAGFLVVQAQGDKDLYKKVETSLALAVAGQAGQFENARAEADRLSTDPKTATKAETWYWKAHVYATLYKDERTKAKYPGAEITATEAFQKYKQMNPKMDIPDTTAPRKVVFDIYSASFAQGYRTFNSKKWDSASYFFKYAVEYSDLIFQNKWSPVAIPFDTTSILYAGYAAQNAKKMDDAYKYYTRLADNKVKGEGLADVYRFILVMNADKKNAAEFNKYLALAKQVYPAESWDDYEVDFMNKNMTLAQKVEYYDREDAAGTLTAIKYMHFGDVFANISKDDKAGLDNAKLDFYQRKAADAFKKAYAKSPADAIPAFNAGVIYYNEFNIYDDSVRAIIKKLQDLNAKRVVEKDPKKKPAADTKFKEQTDPVKKDIADLDKTMMTTVDASIEWLEKAFNSLKDKTGKTPVEKSCANKSVDFLANLYSYKRDKSRGKDPKAFDAYEAKYKQYDALHDSFK